MKTHDSNITRLVLLAFPLCLNAAFAQGTAFIYQGSLSDGGSPANGAYDLEFSLYDASTNGNLIGQPLTNAPTLVSNGLFAVTLDFGTVFSGSNYWLQIGAQTNGGNELTVLSPRQPLAPTPYAVFANTASNLIGTLSATQLSGALVATQLPADVITNGAGGLILTGTFNGNGAGLTSLNAAQLTSGTVSDSLLSADVARNNDAFTATWSNNASPYSPTNELDVNAVWSLANNGPIHWLTTQKTNYLVSAAIPSVVALGNPDQTLVNGLEFCLNGNQITVNLGGNGSKFNVQVDGGTPEAFLVPSNQGGQYYFTMMFNTYASRMIRIEGSPQVIDLEVPPTNSIIKRAVANRKLLIVGDSFSDGANGVAPEDTFAYDYLKFHPNADVWVDAVGGSGYSHGVKTNDIFINRLASWVLPNQFDAIIVTGGYNDGSTDSNTLYNAAALYYQTLKSNYPNAFLGVVLPFNSLTPLPAGTTNSIYAIRAACRDNGIPFIDPSGSGTNDVPGANPWIYGYYLSSGNAGGNAAAYISSDGTHPTLAGHLFLEANLDEWITTNIFPPTASSNVSTHSAGPLFTNAAGATFSVMVNAATNGFIIISQ